MLYYHTKTIPKGDKRKLLTIETYDKVIGYILKAKSWEINTKRKKIKNNKTLIRKNLSNNDNMTNFAPLKQTKCQRETRK